MSKMEKQILIGYIAFLLTLLAIMHYAQSIKRPVSAGDNSISETTGAVSVLRVHDHRGLVCA